MVQLKNPFEADPPLLDGGAQVSLQFGIGFLRNPISGLRVSNF
jgi:hypothetical protein